MVSTDSEVKHAIRMEMILKWVLGIILDIFKYGEEVDSWKTFGIWFMQLCSQDFLEHK